METERSEENKNKKYGRSADTEYKNKNPTYIKMIYENAEQV